MKIGPGKMRGKKGLVLKIGPGKMRGKKRFGFENRPGKKIRDFNALAPKQPQ